MVGASQPPPITRHHECPPGAAVNTTYHVSKSSRRHSRGADRGANGGIAGSDTRRISDTGRTVDVVGIDDHELPSISIVSAGAVVSTHLGPAIVILNQYGWYPGGTSIHSSGQMEHFGNIVDDPR
jgi:hypothetical protein